MSESPAKPPLPPLPPLIESPSLDSVPDVVLPTEPLAVPPTVPLTVEYAMLDAAVDDIPLTTSDADEDDEPPLRPIDPALIYLILLAVVILGLNPLAPDVRYTLLWTVLIGVGLLSILLDRLEVEIPNAIDMLLGLGFGLLIGVPLLLIASPQLQRTSLFMFEGTSPAFAFQSLALAMPAGETLFFRGALQPTRGLLFTAIAASIWSLFVFFPQLHVTQFPLVAVVIGFAFVAVNFAYSYIKLRFGLFASWMCQIAINILLLFVVRFV